MPRGASSGEGAPGKPYRWLRPGLLSLWNNSREATL